jgi:hypothetical protein
LPSGERNVSTDVQLSRYDLSQLDEGYLARLPEAQLRSLSAKLLADTKAAHERIDQTPDCSSRPPSSRAEPGHCGDDPSWTVALSERHLAGPMLVALICGLSLRMRLSRRRIQEFFADWFGLRLSVATINQCLREAGRAIEPVVEEELLAEIRDSDLLHADETSCKVHGQLPWLGVFTCATTTVFTVGRRTQELLHGVLSTTTDGWLMSDGYWAYRDYDNRLRCLTHLLRKAQGLEDSLDRTARDFREALRRCLETVMDAAYAAR